MTQAEIIDETTHAMATILRAKNVCLVGALDDVETRAFEALWRGPTSACSRGYSHSDIKPRLIPAIKEARALGPIENVSEAVA